MSSFLNMYKKYFDFNGRVTRRDFWINSAIYFFLILIISTLETMILVKNTSINYLPFSTIFVLFSLTPLINLTVRRLHDINKNGWWIILYCIPFLNFWLLFLLCKNSINEGNNYNQVDEEQFLGPKKHWLMIIIATAIIFACGFNKMHVSDFNLFISIIFISVAILIFLILKTSKQKN